MRAHGEVEISHERTEATTLEPDIELKLGLAAKRTRAWLAWAAAPRRRSAALLDAVAMAYDARIYIWPMADVVAKGGIGRLR
eukprot:5079560-Prymnesium_polylepis.1